jgi:hypothetical protein
LSKWLIVKGGWLIGMNEGNNFGQVCGLFDCSYATDVVIFHAMCGTCATILALPQGHLFE